ncbi:CoA transferase [Nonomuraea harbinensis]|uniref:CoA transferase n=1 Tax=Nonomuraea harbinensis TaxID=1286938 RepID=A0ABW1C159_9ACTN|nr:CoA transferase [Nonomuraea harbinensis]
MTGPLDGVKVWDASWVGVGPLTARYLAEYGATVVRTESLRSVDVLRMAPPFTARPARAATSPASAPCSPP